MYWPLGTPRSYTSSGAQISSTNLIESYDGLPQPKSLDPTEQPENKAVSSSPTTSRPQTPPIEHVEAENASQSSSSASVGPNIQGVYKDDGADLAHAMLPPDPCFPDEPILSLRLARNGYIFASITSTSLTIWQTKPAVVLAAVIRSEASIRHYGSNIDLLFRPDPAVFVMRTSLGYLITYSLVTDAESYVYKANFPSYSNVQKRRQSHISDLSGLAPDQFLWGSGEGDGVSDVSVRFRMVIKIDAGIQSVLALDDEIVVATCKPAAVQCIRWNPENSGSLTRTEILGRMSWMDKKTSIIEMTHDRLMNIMTWVTANGRAYAVQRQKNEESGDEPDADAPDYKKLFKGHCFHMPHNDKDRALRAVVNARFSLITLGCADGSIRVYSAKDYAGNITRSHTHASLASPALSGPMTSLSYSADGYCLFAGFRNGWALWSVYGKSLSWSFSSDQSLNAKNGEGWLSGVTDAVWTGGGTELLLASPGHDTVWVLEMARSAVTGCYNAANMFRTVLQTSTSIMVYRGYDLPDLTTVSTEPFLWHTSRVPAVYLLKQWPIRQTAVSPDGRYVAVAGRRGLAHYSVNSGRWKTFEDEAMENEFQVRGGMCWYQHLLVAAVNGQKSYELRLFSRETALDSSLVLHVERLPSPAVLVASGGEDSLLVYTHENVLLHYIFAPDNKTIRLVLVGQIGFNGIVRSPARVRGLTWLVPESQLLEGDPSSDVTVASVLFLVDGKLVLLRPTVNEEGDFRYDMRVIAHKVEFHVSMTDRPQALIRHSGAANAEMVNPEERLQNSLWVFDGTELKMWTSVEDAVRPSAAEGGKEAGSSAPIKFLVDFYPLSILLAKGIALGVESELAQRREIGFSHFRFSIRTQLVLPDILRSYLSLSKKGEAAMLAQSYQKLEYFPHALEILLHRVLDEEVDTTPSPEAAVLPRVLSLLSSFGEYLDIVLRCTRKTEVRQWKTLFAYLPPPQELFEESLQRGSLKTAGGYLLILHTLEEEPGSASEQSVRLLSRAIKENDWDLCEELARFLAAMDETGETLKEAMRLVNMMQKRGSQDESPSRLELPVFKLSNGTERE